MSGDFKPVPLTKLPIDAHKHVRFVDGMVLGVDDFEQEFAYLSERDKLLVRLLAGYGVVRGLRVFVRPNAGKPEVVVSAGMAITPSGDVVRVPVDQCAKLEDWLKGAFEQEGGADTQVLTAYVTAEYATRTSDPVPIPGEPCRTESEVTADSRVVDAFRLELSFDPPKQPEEELASAYLRWIGAIPQEESTGIAAGDALAAIVRAAWEKANTVSPGDPPEPAPGDESLVFGSQPRAGGGPLKVDTRDALRAYLGGLDKLSEVRALSAVLESSATGGLPKGTDNKDLTRLLLAQLRITVVREAMGSAVFVPKSADEVDNVVDTALVPRLLSLRFLLKAALAGLRKVAESAVTQPRKDRRYIIAAAGKVAVAANEGAASPSAESIGGLRAWVTGASTVKVAFDGLGIASDRYVVRVLPGKLGTVAPSLGLDVFDGPDSSRFTLEITVPGGPVALEGLILSIEVGAIVD
jgi:hypothetical protein